MTDSTHPLESRSPYQFNNSLTPQTIELLVSNPELRVLQCSTPLSLATWDLLNTSFFTCRPDVQLRVYGFYGLAAERTGR